jgi:hypothetical protein
MLIFHLTKNQDKNLDLGELIISFFNYYGNLNLRDFGIDVISMEETINPSNAF